MPLLFAAGVVAIWLIVTKIMIPVTHWIGKGFADEAGDVSYVSDLNVPPARSDAQVTGISQKAANKPTRISVRRVLLVIPIVIIASMLSAILTGLTRETFGLRGDSDTQAANDFEKQANSTLPRKVGPGITTMRVEVEEKGLTVFQQIDVSVLPVSLTEYVSQIRPQICRDSTVRDMFREGFYVQYKLLNHNGTPLESVRFNHC